MSLNSPKPKYISNSPAGKDQFKSGSQQRIAVSLAEDIRQQRTPVKLIGLDGAWGAGKSNVISIMKEVLKDSHHVFIYDAWSHQEDLQRRSFLEELTEDLQSKGLIDSKTWKDKLKVLLAKKTEKTTRTVPQLSPGVVSSLLLIVLSPIFAAIASAVHPVGWKILIALLPLIVTAIVWLFAARRNKAYRNLAYLFHLYKEKELETSTEETISEKEPSVTEFRNWMRELSNALDKEVIVVYDNMDRLPKEKMNNLWSMIHTFFSEHGSHENHRHEKIWVIVPFDRAHIGEAFDKEGMADQFISKTFPVVYRVPPVVLTDWWEFFGEKYREAFGDTHASEYDLVKNVFDRHQTKITPRAIITFLNELLSLATAWEDEMPLRYIALFILNKSSLLEDPVANILSGKYLSRVNALFLNDTRVQDYIAALVYNVPVAQASQVALQREILVAIRENDKIKLRQLAEHPSFYSVLEEIGLKEDIEPQPWAAALDLLENTPPNGTDHHPALTRLWSQINAKRQTAAIDTVSVSDTDRILIKRLPTTALQPFISHLSNQLYGASDFKGSSYYNSLSELDELLIARQSAISLPALLKQKTLLPEAFLNYVDAAGEKYPLYKVDANQVDLDRYLAELPDRSTSIITAISYLKNGYQFPKVLLSVENQIVSGDVDIHSLTPIFSVYKLLSNEKPLLTKLPLQKLRALSDEATEDSPEYYELVAMHMGLDKHPLGATMEPAFNQYNDAMVKNVAERVEWYATYGDVLAMTVQWEVPLVQEVAKRLTLENSDDASMSLLETLPHLQKIAENIDVKPEILFDLFDEFSSGFEADITIDNLEEIIPDLKIYDLAFGRDKKLSTVIRNTVRNYLEAGDTKSWDEVFGDESSYPFQLLLKALSAGILKTLPSGVLDGYKAALITYSRQEDAPEFKGAWAFFYEKAPKRSLVATIKDIRDHFITAGEISPAQFLFFERPLRELGKLEEKAGDFVRRLLTNVYEDQQCLSQIVHNAEFYLSLIGKAGDDAVDLIESLPKMEFDKDSDPELVAFLLSVQAILQQERQEGPDDNKTDSQV